MRDDQVFEVSIRPSHGGEQKRTAITVAAHVFDDYFSPLPLERDLPFPMNALLLPDYDAALTARKRCAFASHIAKELTCSILKLIEAQDPRHGYDPEQWAEMNREPAGQSSTHS